MSNHRSAYNAWCKIRGKLVTENPDGAASPTKKAKATPKKKAAKKDAAGDGDDEAAPATPTKSPRKRAPRKQDVDGETSPKKKGRATKPKKSEETVGKLCVFLYVSDSADR
jgi:hypothetical protein